jgi:hypothetical protein
VIVASFTGLTTNLGRDGVIVGLSGAEPTLWQAERSFLWQLANSVPLLAIPRTVGWEDPLPMADALSGAILLIFKLVIIAPLIRIAIGAYRAIEERLATQRSRWYHLSRRGVSQESVHRVPITRYWRNCGAMFVLAFAAFGALGFLAEQSSPARRGPTAAVVALCLLAGLMVLANLNLASVDTFGKLAILGVMCLLLVTIVLATAAAATLALSDHNLARLIPTDLTGRSAEMAVMAAYGWSIVDALPGPDIPATLHWSIDHTLAGPAAGYLLLATNVAVFAVLAFPVARAVRVFLTHAWPPPPAPAALPAASTFARRLDAAQAALDEWEALLAAPAGPTRTSRAWTRWKASIAVSGLSNELDRVTALFGLEEPSRNADAAAGALRARSDDLEILTWIPEGARGEGDSATTFRSMIRSVKRQDGYTWRRRYQRISHEARVPTVQDLARRREQAAQSIRAYATVAAELLHREAMAALPDAPTADLI